MAKKIYFRTTLTTGGDESLSSISGSDLNDGDICSCYVEDSTGTEYLYNYRLNATCDDPEDSPYYIAPDELASVLEKNSDLISQKTISVFVPETINNFDKKKQFEHDGKAIELFVKIKKA